MKKFLRVSVFFLLAFALILAQIPVGVLAEKEEADVKQIYIFHTNDVHGRVVGDSVPGKDGKPVAEGLIGFARYKGVINVFKELYEDSVLVLDAGDAIHGTNFASLSKGQSVVRLYNEIGVDASVLGNHEFNYSSPDLQAALSEADFPMLAANVLNEEDQSNAFESNVVFEVNGLKIGVFGLATPETKVKASPLNTVGLEFADPVAVAEAQVAQLAEQGVDAIVMLSHLGTDAESAVNTYTVLDAVEGIDLVVDGHSHTYLPEGEVYNDVLIASTGEYLKNIGLVSLTFTDGELSEKTAELISFVEAMQYPVDQAISDSIAAVETENERITGVEIGTLLNDLDGERENVRAGETNLSQLVADALLWATNADCVLTNGGGIRASIPAGTVTFGDFLTVLPFGNMVTVIEVSGQDIIDALNYGTDAYPETAGKFPQVAGMSFELVAAGDVQNVKIQGEDIDPEKMYALATNDFLAIGGDGYEMFVDAPQILLHGLMVELVVHYVESELMNEAGEFSYELTEARLIIE